MVDIDSISLTDDGPDTSDTSEASDPSGDGRGSGEWVVDMIDKLDEKGMLDAILFGPEGAAQLSGADSGVERSDDGDGGEAIDADGLDADTIAQLGKQVIDTAGDRKISELVYLAENRPEKVNQLIQQNFGGSEDETAE